MSETEKGERVAKVIARAGLCSRRDAEAWILAGRVKVDGKPLTSPAATVTATSRVEVDGDPLPAVEAPRLFRYHKPRGEITSARDPQGRTTVFDHLPAGLPRLHAVGRLDINSEGLLLFTNDATLKRQLELPSNGWKRTYRVRAHGNVHPDRLKALAKGITVDGVDYGPVEASLDRQTGANAWLTFTIGEGKNREVRKICAHLGLTVNRLIRTAYGPFTLGLLPKRALEEQDLKRLRQALGLEPKEKKTTRKGFAKAKARPNRPGSKRGFKHQREASEGKDAKAEDQKKRQRRSPKAEAAQKKAAAAQKTGTKKTGTKKTGTKKTAKKTVARPAAKKTAVTKTTTKKTATKKPLAKKPLAKKPAARKPAARKSAAKPKRHANRRRPS